MRRLLPVAALLLLAPAALPAQIPDARLNPRGSLRWSFTPSWRNWDRVLDLNGNERLLRSFVSSDSAGRALFSTLGTAEDAVRAIPGNSGYRLTLGALTTKLDADVRGFPLEFSVGLGSRLTVTGTFPLVVTRMNSELTLDSTAGNAGWNQLLSQAGNAAAVTQINNLLAQLLTGATQLAQRIAAGTTTCPQPQAQALLTRTQSLRTNLVALTGSAFLVPPAAAPTQASPAGVAITSEISAVFTALGTCGVGGITNPGMALPTRRFAAADVQTMLTAPGLGYEGSEFRYTKYTGLGDAELGLRFGAVQSDHARLVLFGSTKLPTGTLRDPGSFTEIAPGDHQLDVTAGFEAVLDPGTAVSLSLAGSYTRQFPAELDHRVAPQEQIISSAPVARVQRDLGDFVILSAFPGVRLNDAFRVYAGGTYYRKGTDRYSGASNADQLSVGTSMESLSFGGGIQYRSVNPSRQLPVEAGLTYSAVYQGNGGFTPKSTTLTMYLRFYYWLWGKPAQGARGTGSGTTP